MPWASFGAVEPYSIPNDMSAGGLTVMAIVVVICLGFLLIPVMLAGRAPRHHAPQGSGRQLSGSVYGGAHAGEGRSVAPHRDEEAEKATDVQSAEAAAQSGKSGGEGS